ncbi:glycosyltransferase family 2 protein [bacterium]|nr:glycosyltransferase family 2 protein [bacterium]
MLAVAIPCFRVKSQIGEVLSQIGPEVERIYVVDDACPEQTGKHVQATCRDPRVRVLFHEKNQGVGGATLTGFKQGLQDGASILVKLDGDGQMNSALIPALTRPLREGFADYTKGNRFFSPAFLSGMPVQRLLGNSALSFISKISSGYWRVMDPTNGFIAIHSKALASLPIDKIARSYFFESDLLFRLNTILAVVVDVPMPARYGCEPSSLRVWRILFPFFFRHLACFSKRVFYGYFLRDFNLGSVQGIAGLALTGFGALFGALTWHESAQAGRLTPTGTVMIAVLPILIGIQLLLSAVHYDILNEPRVPLQKLL